MSQFGIIVNVDKCIGCQACFVACKEENKVAPGIQWNQIHRAENLQDRIINYFRVSCQHCDNPACLPVCPAKAIYKGPHGEVLVDQSKCIGWGGPATACPRRAPGLARTVLRSSTEAARHLTGMSRPWLPFRFSRISSALPAKPKDARFASSAPPTVKYLSALKPALLRL